MADGLKSQGSFPERENENDGREETQVGMIADYPGAIVVEARHYGYVSENQPKTWGFHTPEEPADDEPSTPDYIAYTDRLASYTYFVSTLGFVFQLVPESEGAYAHALIKKPAPTWSDGTNLNLQSLSLAFEGYAATIHLTMPRGGPQWNAAVDLVAHRTKALGLHLDWSFQHKDVSVNRSDCGQWDQVVFMADVIAKMEGDMMLELARHTGTGDAEPSLGGRVYSLVGPFKIHLSPQANEAMEARGAMRVRLGDTDTEHDTRLEALSDWHQQTKPYFAGLMRDVITAIDASSSGGGVVDMDKLAEAVADKLAERMRD